MVNSTEPWLSTGDTLICFGDSLTAKPTGYVSMLAEALSHHGISVINAGRGGDKAPWAMTRLQTDVIDRRPAAVSIFLGANDAAVGRGRWVAEPVVTPEGYRHDLVWMVHLCRVAGIKKFSIATPLDRYEGPHWREFGNVLSQYRQAARDSADQSRARLVPLDAVAAEYRAAHPTIQGLCLTTDGVHLTAMGNRLVADTMLATWNFAAPAPLVLKPPET